MESAGICNFVNLESEDKASVIGLDFFHEKKWIVEKNENIQISDANARKRCPFSKEEDELLLSLVQYYGLQSKNVWNVIAGQMKNRSVRQCRERYQLFLTNDVKKGIKWSKEEDNLLISKYQIFGTHWKRYEPFFDGRTSYNIKNRFKSLTSPKKIIKNIPNIPKINHIFSTLNKKQNVSQIPKTSKPKSFLKIDSMVSFSTEKNDDNYLFFIDNNENDFTIIDELDQNEIFNNLYF